MRLTITMKQSKGHDENEILIPDYCGCGMPITTAYRSGDTFICMTCHRKGK